MKSAILWLILLWEILATGFASFALYEMVGIEIAGARHESSHAVLESHEQDEALEILAILDSSWVRGNQSSLALLVTGLLLCGFTTSALRNKQARGQERVS